MVCGIMQDHHDPPWMTLRSRTYKFCVKVSGYYCINSEKSKGIVVHYFLQPHHIFIRVKAFDFMLIPGGLHFLIIST